METLTLVMFVTATISVLACFTVHNLLNAVEGYEDKNGFHTVKSE